MTLECVGYAASNDVEVCPYVESQYMLAQLPLHGLMPRACGLGALYLGRRGKGVSWRSLEWAHRDCECPDC